MLRQRDTAEDIARTENLRELVNAVAEGAERGETLEDFLDRAALVSDADNFDDRAAVTLLTLHTAKGLEFDHVFLTGLEEGTFPHSRCLNNAEELEEERRLCYVGMTRARDTLTLTRAIYRRIYGTERLQASAPSRFLQEIPRDLIETAKGSLADAGETRRYESDPEYSYSAEEFSRRVRHLPPGRRPPDLVRWTAERTPRARTASPPVPAPANPIPSSASAFATLLTAWAPSSASKAKTKIASSPSASPATAQKNSSSATPIFPGPSPA